MSQTEQVFCMNDVSTVTGDPVKISTAPPGFTFLFTQPNELDCLVFCVECGVFIAQGFTPEQAIERANDTFKYHSQHTHIQDYMTAFAAAFVHYKGYIWARYLAIESFNPGKPFLPQFPIFPNPPERK